MHQIFPKRSERKRAERGKLAYRLDNEATLAIVQDYESGLSGDQAAAKYDVSRWTVRKLVAASGGLMRYRRLTPGERQLIADLHAQRMSKVEIAKQIRRSPSLVWHCLSGQFKNLTG